MTYEVYALSDDCTCKWVNYSDYSGWVLRWCNPSCPDHGWLTEGTGEFTPAEEDPW
jgi:hypothetical protein